MSKLGLVTVLYNSDDVLEGFMKSLSSQTYKDYHLYLVDNTSNDKTDNLIEHLTTSFPINKWTHIKNDSNVGVAKGNNIGIRLSLEDGADHILLLNNDIEFSQPDLIERMINKSNEQSEKIIIPKILFFDTGKVWMAGGTFSKTTAMTRHIGEGNIDSGKFQKEEYFKYAPTCFMLLDKQVFTQVGMMDEKYFVYYDDTDFIYRATRLGYRILYLPELEVKHKVSSSTGGQHSSFSQYYTNRNRIYFIRKNFSGIDTCIAMSYTLITRVIVMFSTARKFRSAILKGIFDGFKL